MRTKHIDLVTKVCNICQEEKPATTEFFSPHKGSLNSKCKPCTAQIKKVAWAKLSMDEQKRRSRQYALKRLYGMTVDEYNIRLASQDSKCIICERTMLENKRPLAVDHNNETGAIRDLLCDMCNRGLGFFNEDADRLLAAAFYLLRHQEAN